MFHIFNMYFNCYKYKPHVVYAFFLYFSSEKVALQALKASDWHLESAFDIFYSQPQIRGVMDMRHLEELYNHYKGKFYFGS